MKFVKMHALGNDMMLVDRDKESFYPTKLNITELSDRNSGIGFDQLLLMSDVTDSSCHVEFYNSNGTLAMQCCNGLRCAARYVFDSSDTDKVTLTSAGGCSQAAKLDDGDIALSVSPPKFIDNPLERLNNWRSCLAPWQPGKSYAVDAGNLHLIIVAGDWPLQDLRTYMSTLQARYPQLRDWNITLMEPPCADACRIKVYERGAGETFACGSAAVSVASVVFQEYPDIDLEVLMPGGPVWVKQQGASYRLKGPAEYSYYGEWLRRLSDNTDPKSKKKVRRYKIEETL